MKRGRCQDKVLQSRPAASILPWFMLLCKLIRRFFCSILLKIRDFEHFLRIIFFLLNNSIRKCGILRQNGRAPLRFRRVAAEAPYPLPRSSLPSRKSSLRLGDARRPYSARPISPPRLVAGGFQRGAHIPLWRAFFAVLPRFASKRARSAPSPRKRTVSASTSPFLLHKSETPFRI